METDTLFETCVIVMRESGSDSLDQALFWFEVLDQNGQVITGAPTNRRPEWSVPIFDNPIAQIELNILRHTLAERGWQEQPDDRQDWWGYTFRRPLPV